MTTKLQPEEIAVKSGSLESEDFIVDRSPLQSPQKSSRRQHSHASSSSDAHEKSKKSPRKGGIGPTNSQEIKNSEIIKLLKIELEVVNEKLIRSETEISSLKRKNKELAEEVKLLRKLKSQKGRERLTSTGEIDLNKSPRKESTNSTNEVTHDSDTDESFSPSSFPKIPLSENLNRTERSQSFGSGILSVSTGGGADKSHSSGGFNGSFGERSSDGDFSSFYSSASEKSSGSISPRHGGKSSHKMSPLLKRKSRENASNISTNSNSNNNNSTTTPTGRSNSPTKILLSVPTTSNNLKMSSSKSSSNRLHFFGRSSDGEQNGTNSPTFTKKEPITALTLTFNAKHTIESVVSPYLIVSYLIVHI
jgi:hypothetical protein